MKSTVRDGVLRGGVAAAIRLLLLAAAGISAYLLSVSLRGGAVAGCAPGSDCDAVLNSPWAYLVGVPVSALALVVDIALLAASFACTPKSPPQQRRSTWTLLLLGSVLLLGAALWFTALQAIVLKQFCPWCLAAHGAGALAAILLLSRLPLARADEKEKKTPGLPARTALALTLSGLVALALLGVAQTLAPRKTYEVTTVPAGDNVATQAQAPQPTNQPTAPTITPATPAPALFPVLGGQVTLDLAKVPIWGRADAPVKAVSLFDYTCKHCQEMHERLVTVQREFGDKLAIISLPMPLDAQCNPLLKRTNPAQAGACDYARLSLAVWLTKRDALIPFDDWLFHPTRPPPLTEATNKAVELVGAEALGAALRDPWVDQQIQADIDLYKKAYEMTRQGNMPLFIVGTNMVHGVAPVEKLREVIAPYVR